MEQKTVITTKIPSETAKQYTAWLLYCETNSIRKLLRQWEMLWQGLGKSSAELEELKKELGKPVSRRMIEKWSKKYHWVERKDLKLTEDLEIIKKKSEKIKQEKLHRIADAFERVTNKIIKRLKEGEEPTISEWKQIWEMLRTELGETVGKQEVITFNTDEQRPPEYHEHMEPLDTLNLFILEDSLCAYQRKEDKKRVDKYLWLIYEMTHFIFYVNLFRINKTRKEILKEVRSSWEKIRGDFYTKKDIRDLQEEMERHVQTRLSALIGYPKDRKEPNPLLKHKRH